MATRKRLYLCVAYYNDADGHGKRQYTFVTVRAASGEEACSITQATLDRMFPVSLPVSIATYLLPAKEDGSVTVLGTFPIK